MEYSPKNAWINSFITHVGALHKVYKRLLVINSKYYTDLNLVINYMSYGGLSRDVNCKGKWGAFVRSISRSFEGAHIASKNSNSNALPSSNLDVTPNPRCDSWLHHTRTHHSLKTPIGWRLKLRVYFRLHVLTSGSYWAWFELKWRHIYESGIPNVCSQCNQFESVSLGKFHF